MICIVGADGFLGSYIQQHILTSGITEPVLCLNHGTESSDFTPGFINLHFDLQNEKDIAEAVNIMSAYDDIRIIFLAAVHNPDIIKRAPMEAEYINSVCYENFLNAIKALDIRKLIYASSDTVYGESLDGFVFSENDATVPINIYGRHKLLAEEITLRHGFIVARYSYMYAPSVITRKKHFYDEVCEKLKRNEKVFMFTDWVRNVLTYKQAAQITLNLLYSDTKEKILNICGDIPTSKYALGLIAAEYVGADPSLVIPCTSDELGIFTEKRANEILMDNTLARQTGIFSGI